MRIGVYDPYLDDLGGGEKYMMTIAESLSYKHKVSVFWDNAVDLENIAQRFDLDLSNINIEKNIFTSKISLFERLLVSKNYDIIIFLTDGSLPLLLSKKLYVHIQQPLTDISFSTLKHKVKIARINGVFYNSEFSKNFNDKKFNKLKSTVIYPPVDNFSKDIKKENIILHVGRYRVSNIKNDDYKKQKVLISVFKKMCDEGLKNWKLIIATSINDKNDDSFNNMLKSSKNYPIDIQINKANKDLWNIYNRAKIYWHASGYGEDLNLHPEYAEHFGITTVEAMSAGVVPVVINAGGQKEIVDSGENGYLWDSLNELVSKTKLIIDDEVLRVKMSINAKRIVKVFNKASFIKKIEEFII